MIILVESGRARTKPKFLNFKSNILSIGNSCLKYHRLSFCAILSFSICQFYQLSLICNISHTKPLSNISHFIFQGFLNCIWNSAIYNQVQVFNLPIKSNTQIIIMISVYINVIDLYQEIRTFCSAWQQLLAKENFNFRSCKFNLRIFFVEISVWVSLCIIPRILLLCSVYRCST